MNQSKIKNMIAKSMLALAVILLATMILEDIDTCYVVAIISGAFFSSIVMRNAMKKTWRGIIGVMSTIFVIQALLPLIGVYGLIAYPAGLLGIFSCLYFDKKGREYNLTLNLITCIIHVLTATFTYWMCNIYQNF